MLVPVFGCQPEVEQKNSISCVRREPRHEILRLDVVVNVVLCVYELERFHHLHCDPEDGGQREGRLAALEVLFKVGTQTVNYNKS